MRNRRESGEGWSGKVGCESLLAIICIRFRGALMYYLYVPIVFGQPKHPVALHQMTDKLGKEHLVFP